MKFIKSKAMMYITAGLMVWVLLASACSTGFVIGNRAAATPTPPPVSEISSQNSELFTAFWQAWQLVHDNYVDQPVDDVALMRGAIKGMMDALGDQHSTYMDPTQYISITTELQGKEYEGIGAWVNIDGSFLTITEPMPGSPAEKAGLKAGDQIIAVDGEDMTGILPELARQKVIGPQGTTVKLTIQREGVDQPFEVEVTRAAITTPSVSSKMLDSHVAYVRLFNFGQNTTNELRKALDSLLAEKPIGLILDLRYNGGGYLQTGVQVASEFIDKGVIVIEESGDGTRQSFEALKGGKATDIPMVVLVNKYSASASEIVAGAIQDYGRGKLVGETTFGKGSVQNWIPLVDDQGAVRITIARWLTPKGRQIHQVGLTPDVEVTVTEEDIQVDKDPQLDKAVELLTQQ
jgi:carboxyl-terminal processing protease